MQSGCSQPGRALLLAACAALLVADGIMYLSTSGPRACALDAAPELQGGRQGATVFAFTLPDWQLFAIRLITEADRHAR